MLLLNNMNLHLCLAPFLCVRVIAQYWSNFCHASLTRFFRVNPLNLRSGNSASRTRDTDLSCGAKHISVSWTVCACITSWTDGRKAGWRDGQTDRMVFRNGADKWQTARAKH